MQNRYKKQSCGQKMYRFKNQTRLYFSQLFFSTLLSWVTTNINQYPNIYEYLYQLSIVSALGSWLLALNINKYQ